MSTTAIVRVDPKTLLIGPNVRKEVTLRKEFVASVQQHGILVPIIAQQTADGLEVVDGQMRTLAAVDADLTEVPVFVQPAIVDEASRIVEQIVVNEDRAGLTTTDHVAAIAQLALDFKLPAAEIAKRTGATKTQVAAVVTASKSPHATAAIGQEGVTLELAAKIAEAGLSKADTKRVIEARWNKDHALQQILDERAAAARTKELEKETKAAGVAIAAKPSTGDYYAKEKNKHLFLDQLVDRATDKPIALAEHADCPGHAAYVGVRGYNGKVEVHYLCTDPAKNGHRDKNRAAPTKLTPAEREQKQLEKARAEQWLSVTTVRTTWVREQLLTRRTMPTGWDLFLLHDLTETHARAWGQWQKLALELLQRPAAEDDWYPARTLAAWAAEKPINAARAALASVIARHEAELGVKGGWSKVSPVYLRLLAEWGYGLSEIEQAIVDAAGADA
ncbi:ParB N-terminal domain-containing protein [Microbacterium sp. CFH 90308]|uniref:ParB N-terminal domain-containing protein n=1 Tax=Microbacterium salsuginis TaxID=2722803 RepID=A0ABX1K6T1_9MICO|nr:ParB N-terminal domain-containing protein [Microbacterium sp. CFH 90308]NLP82609.1 ParB N-terminal domain-containing protein [Microbacterium sp. CFH 90308]